MKNAVTRTLKQSYLETGPPKGTPVFLMHGFPYDVHAYEAAARSLSTAGFRCIIPYLRGFGPTEFLEPDKFRSGQQAALGMDLIELMDALEVKDAILTGYDWGGRAACIVAALWPDRACGLVSCGTGYNIQNIAQASKPAAPEQEHRYWYQHYFQTERGRAGLAQNRRALTRLLWRLWSPTWSFDEVTFERTVPAFDNPDFVDVVIHSYRHRYGGVAGDPELSDVEARLAARPGIGVPTVVLQGADDGVEPPPEVDADRTFFSGPYECRLVAGAGHNLPQEKPDVFVKAVMDVAKCAARM